MTDITSLLWNTTVFITVSLLRVAILGLIIIYRNQIWNYILTLKRDTWPSYTTEQRHEQKIENLKSKTSAINSVGFSAFFLLLVLALFLPTVEVDLDYTADLSIDTDGTVYTYNVSPRHELPYLISRFVTGDYWEETYWPKGNVTTQFNGASGKIEGKIHVKMPVIMAWWVMTNT